jgi:antiphage defense system Thoeris ThsB-like protein
MNDQPTSLFGTPIVKRRVFFSFHDDDIMRVNDVRNAWMLDHPDAASARSFLDSSLWESKEPEGEDALKRLIGEGVQYTSAVCVLIGTDTWSQERVHYEIARAVIDSRGLLGVHINGLKHHQRQYVDLPGINPFRLLGVRKHQPDALAAPIYHLAIHTTDGWQPYTKYAGPVPLPRYLRDPAPGETTALSTAVPVYDFIDDNGHRDIGAWVDTAVQSAGG